MRKGLSVICAAVMSLALCASALAEISHPAGPGQLGYEAVVLSKNVSLRPTTNANAKAVKRLNYGDRMAVMPIGKGWCEVYLSETEGLSGYVLEDYILIDPAYIIIEESTPVYAWKATNAKRVGLISREEKYPIIRMEGNWLLISLRGAAGWILRPEGEAGGTARRRRNCRHCRRRRSRRRQALPLMSRSLRSFDFRLLNRNAPDVPWDGTAGAKNGEIAPGVPFLGTSGAIAMSDAPRGGVLRAAGVGYACVGCAGVRCSARTSAKSLTGTGEKRPKVFRQRGQAVMICSGLLAVRLSMAPRVMGSRSS